MIPAETGGPAVVTDFPHDVTDIEHLWIPMSDGTRLSARIWLPEGAENAPAWSTTPRAARTSPGRC